MSTILEIHKAGPALSIQDLGRPGWRAQGLSRGGALDFDAHCEGAAILGQSPDCASIEIINFGGEFSVTAPSVFTLTGASVRAFLGQTALETHVSYAIKPGERLSIRDTQCGYVSYLHFAGGIGTEEVLHSRSMNAANGLGSFLKSGSTLPIAAGHASTGRTISPMPRDTAEIGVLPGFQTHLYSKAEIDRFESTEFVQDLRLFSRQGIALDFAGDGFKTTFDFDCVSDAIVFGDIQIIGSGKPFVLLSECQTIGGYPRIATILMSEIGKFLRMPKGESFRFKYLDEKQATRSMEAWRARQRQLQTLVREYIRDPKLMADLLSYNLIGGVISGWEE